MSAGDRFFENAGGDQVLEGGRVFQLFRECAHTAKLAIRWREVVLVCRHLVRDPRELLLGTGDQVLDHCRRGARLHRRCRLRNGVGDRRRDAGEHHHGGTAER
jgi:hypothetical protein